ncbi:hypothetical protein ACS0TY_032171 [Phlomoides rotata]
MCLIRFHSFQFISNSSLSLVLPSSRSAAQQPRPPLPSLSRLPPKRSAAQAQRRAPAQEAPVHQMQQYYRLGSLDNCTGKWGALYDCLALKTKRVSEVEEILEAREKSQHHIWSFRTPNESKAYWKRLFGHLE